MQRHATLRRAETAPQGISSLVEGGVPLTDAHFRAFADLIKADIGIFLRPEKREMLRGRLQRRLRALDLDGFDAYLALLASPDGVAEREMLINAITTNLTQFFREPHHFDHLRQTVLPMVEERARRTGNRRLRFWSAACSSGQEAYSIAAVLAAHMTPALRGDARILATDVDTNMVAATRAGRYPQTALPHLPAAYRTYFKPVGDAIDTGPVLRALVRANPLNLLDPWPMKGLFDAIFCRNVLIYFDRETQRRLVDRLVHQLVPGGWLYLGHAEALSGAHRLLAPEGHTIYRRIEA